MEALIVLWVVCGWINWHLTLGDFTARFPEYNHVGISTFMAVAGPLGLPVALILGQPLTWQGKPYTCQQRWDAFNARCPHLGMEYFRQDCYDCRTSELK